MPVFGTGTSAQFANFHTVTGDGPDIYTPGGIAEATAVALSPDNAVVGSWSVRAGFDYGDSNEDVRQAVLAAVVSRHDSVSIWAGTVCHARSSGSVQNGSLDVPAQPT